ncbi:MAG: ATP-dependent sacrificial sulfur transferase LarE [Candidatus Omnitrophica bacterium]|nr:ATP-dependent sacrificial sulfur transferase LarE [Candidatus Omnitrophota bacterium]
MITNTNFKLRRLKQILKSLESVVVAYSGGLDSTFLLKVALDTLGKDNVLAVTARSETYPLREFKEATALAKKIRARHMVIKTSELGIKGFRNNPVNRCYYCKKELFKKLKNIAKAEGLRHCIDGTNYDDLKDIRYGRLAAKELGIKSPLLEAKITKREIRDFSKAAGLATWEKPSFACLASRFPHKTPITNHKLYQVDRAEEFLRGFGVRQVRVRHYGKLARIEVLPPDITILTNKGNAKKIDKRFRQLGFLYTTVDLRGYRTGSMNE